MIYLPIEILTNIARHLSFSDRKSFALVCMRFYQSVHSRDLWKNVTFVIGKTLFPQMHIHFMNILTNIKFFSVNIRPHELSEILKHTHNLLHLDLIICQNLFQESQQFNFYFKDNICPEVKDVLMNLQTLNLSGNKATITDDCFNCLLDNCGNLSCLDLSELEIETMDSISNWSIDEGTRNVGLSTNDWKFSKFLSNTLIKYDKLTFSNIIPKVLALVKSLKHIKLCSTQVGYDELFILATMPNLNLRTIQLDNCKNIDTKTIQMLLRCQGSSLEELSLINTVPITMGVFVNCLTLAKNLAKIRIQGNGRCEMRIFQHFNLKEKMINYLHLEYCSIDDHIVEGLNQLKLIKKLHLLGCNFNQVQNSCFSMEQLKELNLSRSYGFQNIRLIQSIFCLSKLETLLLDWLKISDLMILGNDLDEINGLASLMNLQSLSFIGCGSITGPTLGWCLKSLKCLRILCIQGVKDIDDNFLDEIIHLSKTLEELNLSGTNVSDNALVKFLGKAFKLRKLRIDNCCHITENLVTCLPVLCPYLQDLSMRNCDNIEYPIALNYYDSIFLHEWQLINADLHK